MEAKVNDKVFEISFANNQVVINGDTFELDIEKLGERRLHIIKKHHSYLAEIINIEEDGKRISIKINNNIYEVSLKSKLDKLLEKLGMYNLHNQVANDIKAPMPGLILDIMVKENQRVKKGDSVLILEAMKMENMIKSPTDGIITKIQIEKGQSVEKNTVLVLF